MSDPTPNGSAIVAATPGALLVRPVARPAQIIEAHKEAVALINEVLEHGTDIVNVPGTDKPCLSKAGAERLNVSFGTHVEYDIVETEVDHSREIPYRLTKWVNAKDPGKAEKDRIKSEGKGRNKKTNDGWVWQVAETEEGSSLGLYRYVVRATVIQTHTGRILGTGLGSCSSLEAKYIRSPRDAENTVLKIAKKRAYVDGTLTAFALSDRFTQDVEDAAHSAEVAPVEAAAAPVADAPFSAGGWFKEIGGTKPDFDRVCAAIAEHSPDKTWGQWFKEAAIEGVTTLEELDIYLGAQLRPVDVATDAEIVGEDDGPGNTTSTTASDSAQTESHQAGSEENPFGGKYPGLGEYVDLTEAQYKKLCAAAKTLGADLTEAAGKCKTKTFDALYEYMTGKQAVVA